MCPRFSAIASSRHPECNSRIAEKRDLKVCSAGNSSSRGLLPKCSHSRCLRSAERECSRSRRIKDPPNFPQDGTAILATRARRLKSERHSQEKSLAQPRGYSLAGRGRGGGLREFQTELCEFMEIYLWRDVEYDRAGST